MFAFDRWLFLLVNAGVDTPRWIIQLARFTFDFLPALVGIVLLAVAAARPRRRPAVLAALGTVALAWLTVSVVRGLFPMPRPAALGLGIQWVEHAARAGFPSMHTTIALAVAGALGWMRWRAAAAVVLVLALGVGWSRVLLGVHFPSDVATGALLGLALGPTALALAHAARRRHRPVSRRA